MTASKNAARVAVQAEPCPKQPVVVWAPCLLVQREAMEAAEKVAHQHPEAIGYSAKRVEVLA